MATAKDFLNQMRKNKDAKKYLYLENTKVRDGEYITYNLKDIDQKVIFTFKAKGFYWAIQYATTWAKNNNAVITGTTLFDCKDYLNRTLKSNCDRC